MFVCVYIYIQSKKDQDQKFTGKAFMLIAKLLTPILVLLVPIYSGLLINGEIRARWRVGSVKCGTNCDPNILYKFIKKNYR